MANCGYLIIFAQLYLNFITWTCISPTSATATLVDDMDTIYTRRVQDIIRGAHNPDLATKWRDELTNEGNWTDVDYTHGCAASRADWLAAEHFRRIITMASLWYQDDSDVVLLQKINSAIYHWFENDFVVDGCITGGSIERFCPCGTPGFWNPNWWYQMILMPRLVGNACLLLKTALSPPQFEMCVTQVRRAYIRIDGDFSGVMGPMTGANLLDVTWSGMSLALLISDQELILDALGRSYVESEMTFGREDGIKVDGSFMQHSGQLLTGSYGSVFISNMIKLFLETQGTELEPQGSVQSAFLILIEGSEWFMFHKNQTGDGFSPILMWEYSVVGRSISHKYSDWRGIGMDLNLLLAATSNWSNHAEFEAIVKRLQTGLSVNPGGLIGTRYFHVTDYLVHRGLNYIVTLKMYSNRTTNSECYNAQNPYGFHLSDGSIFTYLDGDEYTDVFGAWDWYLIPGTTVHYGGNPLLCQQVEYKGREPFVGGLGFGQSGIAVMTYTNPNPAQPSFSWTKTYFFFPNFYVVQYVGQMSSSNSSIPVLTTLDQRLLAGPVYIDGEIVVDTKVRRFAQTLWHDRVGYEFIIPVNLTLDTSLRQSNWSAIGTSEGNETHALMAAHFEHHAHDENYYTYITHLGVSQAEFQATIIKNRQISVINSINMHYSNHVEKVFAIVRGTTYGQVGSASRVVSLAFLTEGEYYTGEDDIRVVEVDAPVLLSFQRNERNDAWKLALSEPSQLVHRVIVRVYKGMNVIPVTIITELPSGAWAGSMTFHDLED